MHPFRYMSKKRAAPPLAPAPFRRRLWLCLELVAAISVLAFLFVLLRIQSYAPNPPTPTLLYRDPIPFSGQPKIAFLFLARAGLRLDFVWHNFFKNAGAGNISIYVHSKPGFKFDQSTTRSAFFYGRHVEDSVQVKWGEASMIEAERLLLRAALQDPANQRFVLLSDSCVPLYNFDYVYNYLMSSRKSFVDSFSDKKERRYNEKMAPSIPKHKWRKGSQWITLIRRHAEVVVDDDFIFPVFKAFCKVSVPSKLTHQTRLGNDEIIMAVDPDTKELLYYEDKADLSQHHITLDKMLLSENSALSLHNDKQGINNVYYETDLRTEWCKCNVTFVPCFLFARKFSPGAAMRLLKERLIEYSSHTLKKNAVFDEYTLIEMWAVWFAEKAIRPFALWELVIEKPTKSKTDIPYEIMIHGMFVEEKCTKHHEDASAHLNVSKSLIALVGDVQRAQAESDMLGQLKYEREISCFKGYFG
ncbi:uncharacterized protein LOC110036799 [Phalaenopsis equestris]|uniref:uncharacterized protein LOC110036799 n=1 Tax=Phalaenopsis equestris TaxID=78828 RepID=UPI0009E1FA0C|nr:uncharacterized protein LOC110036799 [Phalaenopsis equestris]